MTSHESNEVYSEVVMIDNDTSGERPFRIEEKHMQNKWYACLPSPRFPRIKHEIEDGLNPLLPNAARIKEERYKDVKNRGRCDDILESKASRKTRDHTKEWTYKVLNVQSSDLQVVASENFDVDGITTADGHQKDTQIQNLDNDSSAGKEITPADCNQSQHEIEEKSTCELCGSHVETIDEYCTHLKTHCSETSLKCPLCENLFLQKMNLFDHLRSHAYLKDLKKIRTYCNKAFTHECDIAQHEHMHTVVIPYKCIYCNKAFARKGNLERHKRIHTGVKPYKCTYCNKAFTQRGNLQNHELIHTGVKSFKCAHCNKAFARQDDIKKHERIHTVERQYKCTYCNKAFIQKSDLNRHEQLHTGVTPYNCTYCNKAFAQQADLKKHECIHTAVKPFKCTYCNKVFTRQDYLKKHECIHKGVTPYMCTYCNKAFIQKSNLEVHERIHTGFKPYKCTYCNKAFTQQSDLNRHERLHTGVKPYKCTYCNKAFTGSGHLKYHERTHRNECHQVDTHVQSRCNEDKAAEQIIHADGDQSRQEPIMREGSYADN